MPYVSVPKDLSVVKTKVALGLTKRQLVCFVLAGAVGVPTYLLTRGAIGNSLGVFLMIALMLPLFLFAMYEKDGQPLERIIRNMIRAKILRPGVRVYRTDNLYAALRRQAELDKEVQRIAKTNRNAPARGKAAAGQRKA